MSEGKVERERGEDGVGDGPSEIWMTVSFLMRLCCK